MAFKRIEDVRSVVRVRNKKNSEPEKDLTVVDEEQPKGEKAPQILPAGKKKKKNYFFRLSSSESVEELEPSDDASQITGEKKKNVGGGFRPTRFFKNRKSVGDLKVVDEDHPQDEKVLKIAPAGKKKKNYFFKSSATESGGEKKSVFDGFRSTRFFRNRKSEKAEEGIAPSEITEGLKEQVETQEDENPAIKLEHEPSHPSDGRSHDLGVSELLNNEQDWVDLEDVWGKDKRWVPMGWFVLVVISIFCAGGWAIYQVYLAQPNIQEEIIDAKAYLEVFEKEEQEVKTLDSNLQNTIKGYLAATSITEITRYVRFPDRVKPLMQDYYRTYARKIPVFRHIERMRSLNIGKRSFVSVQVKLESGKDYHMLIEQTGENTFKVDWESDVFYQPMRWGDYCDKKPLKPMDFRVTVTPDHYYGFAFRDKEKYQCYKISTLGSDRFLYGYVERETQVAYKLQDYFEKYGGAGVISTTSKDEQDEEDIDQVEEPPEILNIVSQLGQHTIGKRGKNMILRMRFLLEDDSTNCLKIDDLVCVGWAYIEPTDALFTEP